MPEADVDHIYNYPKGYIEDILKSVKLLLWLELVGIRRNLAMVF